jgi:hypothetical protein
VRARSVPGGATARVAPPRTARPTAPCNGQIPGTSACSRCRPASRQHRAQPVLRPVNARCADATVCGKLRPDLRRRRRSPGSLRALTPLLATWPRACASPASARPGGRSANASPTPARRASAGPSRSGSCVGEIDRLARAESAGAPRRSSGRGREVDVAPERRGKLGFRRQHVAGPAAEVKSAGSAAAQASGRRVAPPRRTDSARRVRYAANVDVLGDATR